MQTILMQTIHRFGLCFAAGVAILCGQFLWPAQAAPAEEQLSQFPASTAKKPDDEGLRLPSGKLQRDAIIEHDHKKNLDDLREIHKLSSELIEEMESNTGYVFSITSLKKMEELEKLSKQVKNRFKKQ